MAVRMRSAQALLLGVSTLALLASAVPRALAQGTIALDAINVLATKTEERTTDSLAAVSSVREEAISRAMSQKVSDVLRGIPGLWISERGDDPSTAINIRGLQDFGRVNVLIDGARQNFQRSGHNANGMFYLEPELLSGADVVRGPVANIYGSGAIGGVVSFQTKDVKDILKPGERWGTLLHAQAGSNGGQIMMSGFTAAQTAMVDGIAGVVSRKQNNFTVGRHGQAIANMPAPGTEAVNTYGHTWSELAKLTVRPAAGHEVKIGGIGYQSDYRTPWTTSATATVYDTNVDNTTFTGKWSYKRPEDRLFDFNISAYMNETDTRQTIVQPAGTRGNRRSFNIDTKGIDAHNTSRFDTGGFRHALTYGGDYFRDDVTVIDPNGTGALFTPSGQRTVSGAFAQLKTNYSTWLEWINAVRYDSYELKGGTAALDGDRISPKSTLGITPVPWLTVYGTYAEGYRAPAVTETLVTGTHPPFGPPLYVCPDGTAGLFCFLPNPTLKPETGKTIEAGLNLRHDGVLTPNDRIRAKFNVFRNDVTDYIEGVQFGPVTNLPGFGPVFQFFQYQNIAKARIKGIEFEGTYDAGTWFVELSGHRIRGTDQQTGAPLRTIPPDMIATTFGMRWFERRLTTGVRWVSVARKDAADVPVGTPPRGSYELVNVFVSGKIKEDIEVAFGIDNLFDTYYVRYLDGLPSPGRTYKGALKIRFTEATFAGR